MEATALFRGKVAKGSKAMRRTVVLSVLAVVCLAGAALYLSPDAAGKVRQLLTSEGPAIAGGKAAGSGGDRAVTVVTVQATTADFPIRRYAIGFLSSPAVVEINARVSSAVVAIHVKDGQMVAAGDLLFQLDDRALKAEVDRDQAT